MGVAATGDVNDRVLALLRSKRGLQTHAGPVAAAVPVAQKPIAPAAPAPAPHPGLMPAAVPPEPLTGSIEGRTQRVQRALNVAGYGPIRADGRLDDRTAEAIRKFEVEHGLPSTGRVSDRLIAALVVRSAQAQ
jgi:peptidoglycan hydrolase-like protein with peptidoglycan-binding domain